MAQYQNQEIGISIIYLHDCSMPFYNIYICVTITSIKIIDPFYYHKVPSVPFFMVTPICPQPSFLVKWPLICSVTI